MAYAAPKFYSPPVVEAVLGVQFDHLTGYSTAHAGWFWKEYLDKLGEDSSPTWSRAVDAPRIEDQFGPLLEEFRTILNAFESFAVEAGFGIPRYNQWEIVYVDQLKKGHMWESTRDWSKIFPGLSMPPVQVNRLLSTGDETMSADWRFSLADRRGRMYISLRQLRIPPSNEEVLNVTFVGRGPVTASATWEQGFEIGHEALNETFLAITSPEAQERWKERV